MMLIILEKIQRVPELFQILRASAWFYRTSAGAEIDLVIESGSNKRYAIEIKRSLAPTLSKGFHVGCEDIQATDKFIVYPGKERYPAAHDVTVIPLVDVMNELKNS
ncbi:DUF4143 domain-containing protein [Chitinophaga sancti]|uniref:DUF4143 domain-containing protein n=1 Tax=Chitinophaga sancti TaxID=1004 RepID=UPI003F7AD054